VTRVSKGGHVYLVCSRANVKAKGCRYQAVPYANVEEAFRANARSIIEYAPRGRDTAELEQEILALDFQVSELGEQAQALLDIVMRDGGDVHGCGCGPKKLSGAPIETGCGTCAA